MAGSKIGKFFTSLDIFGHPIGVRYKGKETFQTQLGALCTLIAYILMAFNCYTMTSQFLDNSKQVEKVQRILRDPYDTPSYSLSDHNFTISLITSKPIDPRYGEFFVWTQQGDKGFTEVVET